MQSTKHPNMPTMTASELIAFLRQFSPDTQVTISCQESKSFYFNISDAKRDDDDPSIILSASDDFDSRQF